MNPYSQYLKRFTALVLLLWPISLCSQQLASLRFTHLTLEDGLADNWCHDALMDSYGYMWFATQDGLSRYDGNHFYNFQYSSEDSLSLGGNITMELMEDSQHGLWIASNGGGLIYFDPETEHFTNFNYRQEDTTSISANTAVCLYQDEDNIIWVGMYDSGFNSFDPVSKTFRRFKTGRLCGTLGGGILS